MSTQENIDYVNQLVNNAPVMSHAPEDWCDIIADCHREMLATGVKFSVAQIKEKFGGLRFYYDMPDIRVRDKWGYDLDGAAILDPIVTRAEKAVWDLEKDNQ